MPNLLKYRGYEDDGVEGYLCLNCKNSISIRHYSGNPLEYCPWCGTNFEGGWIKDNRMARSKYKWHNSEAIYEKRWKIEVREITYWGKDIIGNKEENWDTEFRSVNSNRQQLLQIKRNLIKEFKECECRLGEKEELQLRLVYYKYYPYRASNGRNDNEEVIKILKPISVVKHYKKKKRR